MKLRLFMIVLLLFLVACEPEETDEVIEVSETPYLVYVSLNDGSSDEVLVPMGHAMAVGDVEAVTFQYDVSLYSTDVSRGLMRVEAIDVLIGDSDEYAHLVKITVMDEPMMKLMPVFNYAVTITITVELLEPIDEAEALEHGYDPSVVNVADARAACEAIYGQNITFDVSFMLIDS